MTFQTSRGTYGARQPGRAMLWLNRISAQVIKRTGGFSGSRSGDRLGGHHQGGTELRRLRDQD